MLLRPRSSGWCCLLLPLHPPLGGAVSLIGFKFAFGTNQFGRLKISGNPKPLNLVSLVLGLLFLLLLVFCVLLLGSFVLTLTMVLLLGEAVFAHGSFVWCCSLSSSLVLFSPSSEWVVLQSFPWGGCYFRSFSPPLTLGVVAFSPLSFVGVVVLFLVWWSSSSVVLLSCPSFLEVLIASSSSFRVLLLSSPGAAWPPPSLGGVVFLSLVSDAAFPSSFSWVVLPSSAFLGVVLSFLLSEFEYKKMV